jgi:hypothetical protein
MDAVMPTPSTRATRFLTGLATLILIVSVAFGAFLLVGAIFGVGPNGHEVGVHTQLSSDHLTNLPRGALPPDHLDVLVRVRHATRSQIGWVAARDLAPGILVVAAVWLLRRLLRSVRDGDPFTATNVQRLRILGALILVGVPVVTLFSSWCASELATSTGLTGAGIQISIPGGGFIAGVGVFALAEVFAAGVRLQDDLEGTI